VQVADPVQTPPSQRSEDEARRKPVLQTGVQVRPLAKPAHAAAEPLAMVGAVIQMARRLFRSARPVERELSREELSERDVDAVLSSASERD
jgi:hypothetical protein